MMWLKWIFDRTVALLGMVCLSPLYLVVAVLIRVKMPGGPVLFVQERIGKDGKPFRCHKFRTMQVRLYKGLWCCFCKDIR